MEFYIIASILGLGYYLNNDKIDRKPYIKNDEEVLSNVENNIYDGGDKVNNIRRGEFKASNEIYKDARGSYSSNRIESGPPKRVFQKVDYADESIPIEYTGEEGVGVNGCQKGVIQSMNGQFIDKSEFVHNNMQPFFGSKVKQNVEEFANNHRLEEQTGNMTNYRKKTEIPQLFDPQTNLTNPYGSSNLSGYMNERYIVSNIRNSEVPVEKIYVGPGLNNGYSAEPSGGFQQASTRDFCMPKNVDELRTKDNPKMIYHGRIVAGQKGTELGKFGKMTKRRPETSFEHGKERFFGGMAQCAKPRAKENYEIQETHRVETELINYVAPAGPAGLRKERVRANVEPSHRQQFDFDGNNIRNADAHGEWRIEGQGGAPNDYGRSAIRESNKEECENNHSGNIEGKLKHTAPINPDLRYTRKVNGINNPNQDGYIKGNDKHRVYDPNDLPRTTMKETMSENTQGERNIQGNKKMTVYDPNDVLKTTMKETTVEEARIGNADGKTRDDGYQIANIEAKNTLRQFTLQDYTPNANGDNQGGYQNKEINLPNTSRQFTSDLEYTGNAGNAGQAQTKSYEDVYNMTINSVRDHTLTSFTPGAAAPNKMRDSCDLNVTTHRRGPQQSSQLASRANISTRTCIPTPNTQQLGEVRDKMTVSNREISDRLDCSMLDAFKSNPYTQSLQSATLM
jgi:hypothetical protein